MKIAIAHEWLVSYAGSERCVEQLALAYPGARILTTVASPERLPEVFAHAEPSFLQRLPGAVVHYQKLLPLMPASWRWREPVDDVDVVVSSSHACAKAVRIAPGIPHICYCHTPMRYAWEFKLERERFPKILQRPAEVAMKGFRRWDRGTAHRVDRFVANSRDVAVRIERAYGRNADVVHPPVKTDFFTPGGARGEHFLYAGRFVAYKRPDLVVEAFADLPFSLKMVGAGPMEPQLRAMATSNVEFLGKVPDELLRDLMRSARAMIFPAHEDFGIVMAESLACGTPVIALAAGGALDIVDEGETGWLIAAQTVAQLRTAIRRAASSSPNAAEVSARAQRFGEARYRAEMGDILREAAADRFSRR
jgi:glycosyltransferase involved in cell wall biosynthesis